MIFKKIGIFDSGIGGLSLVKELITIPGLELIYYADTAHVPYGNRTQYEIQQLSAAAVQFLAQHKVDAIIIACHTATTNALTYLKAQFPNIYFIDVVELIIQQTILKAPKKIGILGTQATIASNIHKNILSQALPECIIISQECPELASAIENRFNNKKYLKEMVNYYVQSFIEEQIDSLVLACTHYSLIKPLFEEIFQPKTAIIAAEYALLKRLEPFIDKSLSQFCTIQWHPTADYQSFFAKAQKIVHPS